MHFQTNSYSIGDSSSCWKKKVEKKEVELSSDLPLNLTGNLPEALGLTTQRAVSGPPGVTPELVRDAESWAPPLPASITACSLTSSPGDSQCTWRFEEQQAKALQSTVGRLWSRAYLSAQWRQSQSPDSTVVYLVSQTCSRLWYCTCLLWKLKLIKLHFSLVYFDTMGHNTVSNLGRQWPWPGIWEMLSWLLQSWVWLSQALGPLGVHGFASWITLKWYYTDFWIVFGSRLTFSKWGHYTWQCYNLLTGIYVKCLSRNLEITLPSSDETEKSSSHAVPQVMCLWQGDQLVLLCLGLLWFQHWNFIPGSPVILGKLGQSVSLAYKWGQACLIIQNWALRGWKQQSKPWVSSVPKYMHFKKGLNDIVSTLIS